MSKRKPSSRSKQRSSTDFDIAAIRSRADRLTSFDQRPKIPSYDHRSRSDDSYHSGPREPLPASHYMSATAAKQPNSYSGTAIRGIATMHKSNAVPVSNDQDPTDYATMRRN